MRNVSIIPSTISRRAYLDREALRIAAGTHGATRRNVHDFILRSRLHAGLPHSLAEEDAALALQWIDARLEQIAALRALPAPVGDCRLQA